MTDWDAPPALLATMRQQSGVVTRRQLLAAGLGAHEVRRLLRQRHLRVWHPGVYLDHTGTPTWVQQAWAAVLAVGPAALYGASALRAIDGPGRRTGEDRVVHVAIDEGRSSPARLRDVVVHHVPRLQDSVQWHTGPPRQRLEEAVLDVAIRARDDLEAIAALAKACGSRRTTATRLLDALAARPRAARRDWIAGVLRDVRDGTHSVLEHGFLTLVERPHGLPPATRQATDRGTLGVVYRDATYGRSAHLELDGRLFHDSTEQRDRDLDRDLDAVARGGVTARLGWGQVFGRPCRTAARVARFLAAGGVGVTAYGCSPSCPVGALDVPAA